MIITLKSWAAWLNFVIIWKEKQAIEVISWLHRKANTVNRQPHAAHMLPSFVAVLFEQNSLTGYWSATKRKLFSSKWKLGEYCKLQSKLSVTVVTNVWVLDNRVTMYAVYVSLYLQTNLERVAEARANFPSDITAFLSAFDIVYLATLKLTQQWPYRWGSL